MKTKSCICDILQFVHADLAYRTLFNLTHRNVVRILSAHRVIDESGRLSEGDRLDLERGCLSKSEFESRIAYLFRHYRFIGLDEYVGWLDEGRAPPKNVVILTFDDGFRDVCLNAWPLLKTMNIPFTVFLTIDCLDKPGMMSRQDVCDMSNEPLVSWGAHGVTHRVLTETSSEKAGEEIIESKKDVEGLVGRDVDMFCYPDGKFNDDTVGLLKENGFVAACATGRKLNYGESDAFALQRIPFESEPAARFAFRVAGLV